jgi:hypothetical protein
LPSENWSDGSSEKASSGTNEVTQRTRYWIVEPDETPDPGPVFSGTIWRGGFPYGHNHLHGDMYVRVKMTSKNWPVGVYMFNSEIRDWERITPDEFTVITGEIV